ncbi:unnamed protein product [Calicophoron daubneyi]|uniref:Cathepsin F n=1 Tax=Calicophoron daubneyi TaxID=300641 RepID=A0AAV2TH75_CALDB
MNLRGPRAQFQGEAREMVAFHCLCFLAVLIINLDSRHASASNIPIQLLENSFVKSVIDLSVAYIDSRTNSDYHYVLFDLLDAGFQAPGGILLSLNLVVSASGCKKSSASTEDIPKTLATCGLRGDSFERCDVYAYYRPWLTKPDSLVVLRSDCIPTTPSIPKHPELLGFTLPGNVTHLYASFQIKHGLVRSSQDSKKRLEIFKSNLLKMQLFQVLDRGTAKYGITSFSDLTEAEFKSRYATMKHGMFASERIATKVVPGSQPLPSHFDWRDKGGVTPVKNQGACGSCWAFSVTGNIESMWFLKSGKLVSLSEQQLLDCDKQDEGCQGGLPEWAYKQIIQMGGLMSEEEYPYKAKEQTCRLVQKDVVVKISDSEKLTTNETELAIWLSEHGAISVGINANFLQFYTSGISHPPHLLCSKEGLDHAVLLVGFGESSFLHKPFWIVKNSWGKSWGESGYFRLYRGDGTCGINAEATTAIIR